MTARETDTALLRKDAENLELLLQQSQARFELSPAGQMLKQFELAQRMGTMFAKSTLVPQVYQNNVANCAVAVDMAMRMNLPPVMVMQNLYIVHGNPAWSSKFLIACVNGCGRFTPLEYEVTPGVSPDSDDYGYRCVAYAKDDTKRQHPLEGTWVTMRMVKAEGWLTKSGSKWKTMSDQMFRYRAAAFWQRTYAPELSMGIMTVEEAGDIRQEAGDPVDVGYTDISQPKEPEVPAIGERERAAALDALAAAATPDDVRAVRETHRAVYDNDETFHDAVCDRYQTLRDEYEAAAARAQQQPAPDTQNQ